MRGFSPCEFLKNGNLGISEKCCRYIDLPILFDVPARPLKHQKREVYRCAQIFQARFPWESVTVSQRSTTTASPVTGRIAWRRAFFTTESVANSGTSTSDACTVTIIPRLPSPVSWMGDRKPALEDGLSP